MLVASYHLYIQHQNPMCMMIILILATIFPKLTQYSEIIYGLIILIQVTKNKETIYLMMFIRMYNV